MVQNKLEENSKLTYDERKKILHQEKSNTTEYKTDEVKEGEEVKEPSKLIATVTSKSSVLHTEEGIKLAYKGLIDEKKVHDKRIIDLKKAQKNAGEMTTELKELKEKLLTIANIDEAEKNKDELKTVEERLKFLNGEIKDIKEVIGGRLKL